MPLPVNTYGLVLDQVDDALESLRLADRELDRHRVQAQPVVGRL